MSAHTETRKVDQTALRANQSFIISLLLLAFVLNSWPLVAFVGFVMLLGTAIPKLSLFKQLYRRLLLPSGLVKSDIINDNPEPHRFAQGFGGVVLALAVVSLLVGQSILGWALVWLVVILAGLNLFLGFCAGCFLYYQLNKLSVPGFEHSPVK
jgi:hypothetical protein